MKKNDFVGRERRGGRGARGGGGPLRLVSFAVDADGADAIGDEPIWHDGKVVGWVTSGGYGHSVGTSLALGYVPKDARRRLRAASRSRSSASAGPRPASTAPPSIPPDARMRALTRRTDPTSASRFGCLRSRKSADHPHDTPRAHA